MKTTKKALSVLLAVIMIMSSMSVCFGTFVPTAFAADEDAIGTLADKLKDSAYSETLGLLGKSSKSGSKLAQTTTVTFTNYRNFKQAAELLRLLHNAMQATAAWKKASDFSAASGTDDKAGCLGANTSDLYNDLTKQLELKGVTIDNNVKTFIGSIYHMDGATAHSSPSGSSLSNWKNTITYSTTDYKGYLAQIGKASAVESSAEMGVQYVVKMQGNLYYEDGCDKKYHHQLWPAATDGNTTAPTTSTSNTDMKSKVNEHITKLNTYINTSYASMLEMSASALDADVTALNTAISNHVTYVGSQSTYDALYADYAAGIANYRASVESAKAFQDYMPTVDAWNDFVAANPNYGVFQYPNFGVKGSEGHTKLLADFATFKAYRDYLLTGGSIYEYLVDYNYIDETYYTNFYDNVVAYDLQDSKDAADALYVQYSVAVADTEGEGNVEMTLEEKTIVYNQFCGFINNIGNYSTQVVNAVYTDGYQYLIDMREYFKCEINPAVLYFAENAYKSFTDMSTTAIWNEINVAKGHQADLDALYYEVKGNAGEDKANQLLATLRTDAATMIENLYKTLADRFTLEVNNAYALYEKMGKPTTLKVDTFLQLSAVIVAIEPSILTDLQAAGKAGYIAQVTIDRYNELMKVGGIYEIWNAYASTFGFPDYKQTQIQYADRTPMEGDELKTANDPVTEAEMLKLIAALDKIITSDTVGGLLGGLLGAEEGEAFNLGTMLSDLIKGALFTDDFINTVVQMLYPLVLNEFSKVWAGLPQSITYSGINVKVQYQKTLNNILDEGNFEIFPNLLAGKLSEINATKYKDNIDMLNAAGNTADSWTSPKIVDVETGKLKLTWGVTEQAEKLAAGEITQEAFDAYFYQAFEDATAGLLPLLTSLITNVPWTPNSVAKIATGNVNIVVTNVSLEVALQLGSEAHNGYADFLVPIYEILGVPYTAVSNINGSTDVAYVLEQILKPVFAFLDKLGTAPVDTLLEILPDLVYALAFRMAKPALNMLRTRITYDASANLVGSVMNDGADVKVGDMLITDEEDALLPNSMFAGGLNTILAHFGLNIPAIDQATLATLGQLTTMSTNRTAWIYDNSSIGAGKAYTIKADKADVGYYLLSYVLNIVKDPASLSQLLGLFMTQKDADGNPVLDVDGKKIPDTEAIAKLQETLYNDEGLNFDEINVGNAIAAIVELANQPEYIIDAYNWYAGEYSSPVGESVAMDIYANPGNDWTKDKAEYLYNNLDSLLTSILTMAGLDLDAEEEGVQTSIEDALGGLIGGLFSNETVTALAKLLGSLSDLGALLAPKAEEGEEAPEASEPETVAEGEEATEEAAGLDLAEILTDLLKNELGIDLSVYAQYANIGEEEVVDFGVTDAETFVTALTELLKPLKPVVDFILGGKDLTLIDSAITLQGYNGYNNAIIPLLEALGATPAAYTENADTLALTLNALVGVINKITTNDPDVANDGAIYAIIDMLPGVIYYISSNALSQGIDKLLTPVYAILDTIRPIYNVNLGELLAGIEIGEEGNKKPLGLDLKNINWEFIFGLLNDLLGLDLSALQQVIYDVAKSIGVEYTSASTLGTFKKGAYNANFSQADLLTVVLSFVLEWATVADNAAKLDELLKTNGIIASLGTVFADVEIAYGTPNWMYWFEDEAAFDAYIASGAGLPITLDAIDWEKIEANDWDKETAQYFAEHIDELVDLIIGMINKDKEDAPKTLADLIKGLLDGLLTKDTMNDLVGMITDLLGGIDENLIATAGYLLGVDLVGLKKYECTAEIKTISDFINELAYVLDTYAGGLINWLFFGDDYRFAKKSDKTDTIVINGGYGYEKGLAMILEALGCELPVEDAETDAKEVNTKSVLGALATRVDAILANPVDEVLGLLPNLVYFLNANGAGVAVSNLLAPVNVLLDKLSAFGLNINIADLVAGLEVNGKPLNLDLANLSLANIVEIVEGATDLPLDAAEEILVGFCTGKITKGTYIYKMEAAKEDVITILLVVALELVSDDAFAAKLDEMLGTDFIAKLKDVFNGSTITYKDPNWNYMNGIENEGVIEYVNAITSYPNDWTEAKAEYLAENLPALVDTVIKMLEINGKKYESLKELLSELLADSNIFTTKTLEDLLGLIKNFLGGIDAGLLEVGFILDVKLDKLVKYEVKKDIDTVEEFADELAYILGEFAPGVVEWLLLGRDFKLVAKDNDTGAAYITVNGAQGYAEGLALLLEALGCKDLPAATITEENTTAKIVEAVLASLAARIDEILANPVEEVLDLLPNLIYFLDANGVAVVIENTLAALNALIAKLEVFDIKLNINELVDLPELMGIADKYEEGEDKIGLDNLTLVALLRALSLMTGLDFTELQNVLVPFALGEAVEYDSVSANAAYKMVYKNDLDKHDMLSVIVTAALRMFVENEDNAEKLDELLKTNGIVSALKDVFAEVEIRYAAPNWEYTKDNGGEYLIQYPNNWNKNTADYVTANLPAIADMIAGLIDGNYETLGALLTDKVNVFTSANLQTVVDTIANLLAGIDDGLIDAAGVLLGANVAGLKAYKAPEGITTVDAFAAELANVLNTYAKGLVEWFLLGNDYRFFVKEVKDGAPVDFIVINGANGYAEGLALLLEALGCENLPAVYDVENLDTAATVKAVLASLAARIDEILANPVEEILDLLPNLIYFLNANGVAAVVDNTLAAITALLDKLEVFGINVDIKSLVDLKSLMGLEGTDAAISLDNLSMAAVLEAVGLMVELDLTAIKDVLVGFNLGGIAEYDSVSESKAYKMGYSNTFDASDMVTILANLVLITLGDKDNAEVVKGLLGEDAYTAIMNLYDMDEAEVQEFDWQFTDKADSGEVISALNTSEKYTSFEYGPNYTEEMAQYIADNFAEFVDNVIYLLGLKVDGKPVSGLKDLLNGLIGTNLYTRDNVIAIRDALAGVLAGIKDLEVNGKNVGKYIVNVLEKAEIADIEAVADVEIGKVESRDEFVAALCKVIAPFYPALKWILADEDLSFFVAADKENAADLITLKGAEGYVYGIIPLLEALDCEDILAPEAYYAAVKADGNKLLTSILNPLLKRVDEILANPADEVLAMLPNLIYFINSNGVDTVVKNVLGAVFALLNAIEPIAKVDLYGLFGVDLADINFEWLLNKVLEILAGAGYKLKYEDFNALAELTTGTVESYTSLNGKTAYRMVYALSEDGVALTADTVTVLIRSLITFILTENNRDVIISLLKNELGMSEDVIKYVDALLDSFATSIVGKEGEELRLGMDTVLATTYYVFYGLDVGVDETLAGRDKLNALWKAKLEELSKDAASENTDVGKLITDIFDILFNDADDEGNYPDDNPVIDENGVANQGAISFFERIKIFFQEIAEFFRNLFSFGKK